MKQVEGDSEWMCHNQIVQRDDFTSFSILGIVLIFFLGGLFIALDICLERLIIFWYHKAQPRKAWKLRAWRGNRPLQIQSQAFEAKGLGTWDRTTGDVPVTKHQETFVSPCSVTLPEGIQTSLTPNGGHWWQQKSHKKRSNNLGVDDQEADQQQNGDNKEPQTATTTPGIPRNLLPPIDKSILRPLEMEFSKMSSHPRPGYDRLYTDDAEVTP
jgi:hypothetical protein